MCVYVQQKAGIVPGHVSNRVTRKYLASASVAVQRQQIRKDAAVEQDRIAAPVADEGRDDGRQSLRILLHQRAHQSRWDVWLVCQKKDYGARVGRKAMQSSPHRRALPYFPIRIITDLNGQIRQG